MLRIALEEKLLIKQTSELIESPWGYRIVEIENDVIVKSETGLTVLHKVIDVDRDTFELFENITLLLEILDNSGNVIEDDTFILSGVYNQFDKTNLMLGLLGENIKKFSSDNETDFQQGFETKKTVQTFDDADLDTANIIGQYDWSQSFVKDFTPDHRFHREKIIQKKTN